VSKSIAAAVWVTTICPMSCCKVVCTRLMLSRVAARRPTVQESRVYRPFCRKALVLGDTMGFRLSPCCTLDGGAGGCRVLFCRLLQCQCPLDSKSIKVPSESLAGVLLIAPTTLVGANESTPWVCVRVGVAPYTGRFWCLLPRAYVVHDGGIMQNPHPAAYVQQGPQFSTQRKITF